MNACQIEGLRGIDQERFVGSGFLITFKYYQGIPYFMENEKWIKVLVTAAHNVLKIDPLNKTKELFTDLTVYNARKSPFTYRNKYKVKNIIVHPNYDGNPFSGFDLALCTLESGLGGRNYNRNHYSDQSIEKDSAL